MSDHKPARNRLAIEANHFGLDTDTAVRLAARAESMGLLSEQVGSADESAAIVHDVRELRSMLNRLIRCYESGMDVQIETPQDMAKSVVNQLNEILGDEGE